MKLFPLAAATATLLLAGCISHEETVYHDVSRVPVQFENDAAATVFYEALSRQTVSGSESKTAFHLPIIFEHKRSVKSGPNAAFNAAVAATDTNRDGTITESEARIYADNLPK